MKTVGVLFFLAVLAVSGFAPDTWAVEDQPALRENFVLGLGLGWGNAGADLTVIEEVDRENGVAGDVMLGWAVRNDVVLGVEFDLWSQFFRDTRWVFNLSSVTVTYFPFDKGAYLTGGLGIGTTRIEVDQVGSPYVRQDRAGLGYVVAGGFEWRIYEEVALGPRLQWIYMDLDGDTTKSAEYFSIMVQLTWYKPK